MVKRSKQTIVKKKSRFSATIRDATGDQAKLKIGDILKKEGYITGIQLNEVNDIFKKNGGFIGSILLSKRYIERNTIPNLLSRQYNYPIINIAQQDIDPEVIPHLPYKDAKQYFAFPVRLEKDTLLVAMTEPTNSTAVEEMATKSKVKIRVGVAAEKDIIEAYRKYYKIDDDEYQSFFSKPDDSEETQASIKDVEDFGELLGEIAEDFGISKAEQVLEQETLHASDAPIIKLVNGILYKAVMDGVSDIHIEPFKNSFYVRYRVDGALYKSMNLPLGVRDAITTRFKIISNLNITERRLPQDGRFKLTMGRGKEIDFRVSTLPTLYGESIVLRLLDSSAISVDINHIGFTDSDYNKFLKAIKQPNGLVLVTGPTGSGKTTTLYSALNFLNRDDVKILTAEDPVEFNLAGINQVNIHKEIGFTFATALRSFLRQDPDICMIGEIRDFETASIAAEASMTGHLVFSTLHTNDAPATITRLIDMGIPPYNVAAAVTLVTAQRLLRKICPECKKKIEHPDVDQLLEVGFEEHEIPDLTLYEGTGCSNCFGSGYKGRVGIFEIMEMTNKIVTAISARMPENELRSLAIQEGMRTLRQDGLLKIKEGITTVEQVISSTKPLEVSERRKEKRLPFDTIVNHSEDGQIWHSGFSKDISTLGMCLKTEVPAVSGQNLLLEFSHPDLNSDDKIQVEAEVKRSICQQGQQHELGLRFQTLQGHHFRSIQNFFHSIYGLDLPDDLNGLGKESENGNFVYNVQHLLDEAVKMDAIRNNSQ